MTSEIEQMSDEELRRILTELHATFGVDENKCTVQDLIDWIRGNDSGSKSQSDASFS